MKAAEPRKRVAERESKNLNFFLPIPLAARFRGSVAQTSTKRPATQASEQIDQDLTDQQPSPFRRYFQYFGVNSSLKWRGSRLAAAYLQALSPKKTPHESINVSFNYIEIFRPICNLDGMQFAELYS